MNLDDVQVRYISSSNVKDLLSAAIRWGGYGYPKVVATGNDGVHTWALLADEWVTLDEDEATAIRDHYTGASIKPVITETRSGRTITCLG